VFAVTWKPDVTLRRKRVKLLLENMGLYLWKHPQKQLQMLKR